MKQESKIQQEIFTYFHNRYPEYIIHSVPNGFSINIPNIIPARFHKEIRQAVAFSVKKTKQIGMMPGVSDLIIHLTNGRCVMVEVKNEKNDQDTAQKKIKAKMKAMNSNYILVRSLEDFQEQIKKFL